MADPDRDSAIETLGCLLWVAFFLLGLPPLLWVLRVWWRYWGWGTP